MLIHKHFNWISRYFAVGIKIQCHQTWQNFVTWVKFKTASAFFEGLFSVWQLFEPTLAIFVGIDTVWCKLGNWPNIEKWSNCWQSNPQEVNPYQSKDEILVLVLIRMFLIVNLCDLNTVENCLVIISSFAKIIKFAFLNLRERNYKTIVYFDCLQCDQIGAIFESSWQQNF